MNILLIGGSGTLGNRLISVLKNKKNNIMIVCRRRPKNWAIQKLYYKYFFLDYYKDKSLRNKLLKKKIDIVINFICFNEKQARLDFELFKNYNLQKYFFISANGVYKSKKGFINVNDKLDSCNDDYIQDKINAENYLLSKKHLFPSKIIRLSHIYDEQNIPTLFRSRSFTILKCFKNDGIFHLVSKKNNKWNIIHAKDFAKIFKKIINYKKNYANIINISSNISFTWKSLYELYAKYLKLDIKFKYLNIEKIKKNDPVIYGHLKTKSKNLTFNIKDLKHITKKINFLNPKNELKKIIIKNFKNLNNFDYDKTLIDKINKYSN